MFDILYQKVFKPIVFKMDAEFVHDSVSTFGTMLGKTSLSKTIIQKMFYYRHPMLQTNVAGIQFENPIGLAAGFDKNAQLYDILPEVGFGFAELGSVTGEPCLGNPKPRLFRLPQEKSILVNYGLYNDGAIAISNRLANAKFRIPIGISIAKTNDPKLHTDAAIQDYRKAYVNMHSIGDYTTINVSCPNSCDGLTFAHPENLKPLLHMFEKEKHEKPIFLKIKPDMTNQQLSEMLGIVDNYEWITGFVIGNLTTHREGLSITKEEIDKISKAGALSGLPTQKKSTETIKFVHKNSDKIIIGCGGIFNGNEAYEKLKAGASLLQLMTALIYEGPGVISKINQELVELLQKEGFESINDLTHNNKGG